MIPYCKPSITEREEIVLLHALHDMTSEHCYDFINRFEKEFAAHLEVRHALATSSCTGALTLGLAALGISPGDEVILADTNWIATVAPIIHLGAKPVFADILPDSWTIDPDQVDRAITSRTRAIIVTHLYGNLAEMDDLLVVARTREHPIPIIEDAAEALGSIYHDHRAGSLGLFSVFSFHGSKTITTGEGGMLATSDSDLYSRALTLSNHGRLPSQPKQFFPDFIGYKFKMSNLQAALGCAQMQRIEELVNRKREILAYYREHLEQSGVRMNPEPSGTVNGAWMPTVVFDKSTGVTRDKLLAAFHRADIDARIFFYSLSSLPMFEDCPQNRVAYDIPSRAINLPSYYDMTQAEQDRVIEVIQREL
jgi:perosamine synthetase